MDVLVRHARLAQHLAKLKLQCSGCCWSILQKRTSVDGERRCGGLDLDEMERLDDESPVVVKRYESSALSLLSHLVTY